MSDAAPSVVLAPPSPGFMNSRIIASLIVVSALAYACGPRTHADAALDRPIVAQQGFALASMTGSLTPSTGAHEKTLKSESRNEAVKLTTRFGVVQRNDGVEFELRVVNGSNKRVELSFPSGQAYDFIVVDSVGREIWRWAAGRIFTQSVQNKLLGKGEALTISEKWAPAKAGKFAAVAVLRSTNYPLQERVEFERK